MTKFFPSLFVILFAGLTSCSQSTKYFEGTIEYSMNYKTDKGVQTDEMLKRIFGSGSTLSFKDGNYRNDFYDGKLEFIIHNRAENRSYSKKRGNDTLYWTDCSVPGDTILNMKYSPKTDTVLGIICDLLTISYKDRIQKIYYNAAFIPINPDWFEEFKRDQQYLIDRKEKSIDLKNELLLEGLTLIETAEKVVHRKIDNNLFKIPVNSILAKEKE